jgi:hypothetical protein
MFNTNEFGSFPISLKEKRGCLEELFHKTKMLFGTMKTVSVQGVFLKKKYMKIIIFYVLNIIFTIIISKKPSENIKKY